MNDPTSYGRRITTGTHSVVEAIAAQMGVDDAASRAGLIRDATERGEDSIAVAHLLSLFNLRGKGAVAPSSNSRSSLGRPISSGQGRGAHGATGVGVLADGRVTRLPGNHRPLVVA